MRTTAELRDLADATRFRLDLGHGRIDPFEALALGEVVVVRHPFGWKGLDGAYTRTPEGECFAAINSTHLRCRQRFTAAHELAHHLLGGAASFEDFPSASTDVWTQDREPTDAEDEADMLASLVLIDGKSLRDESDRHADPLERTLGVMARFTVSLPAATRRLALDGLVTPDEARKVERTKHLRTLLSERDLDTSGLDYDSVSAVGGAFREWADWLLEAGIIDETRRREALALTPPDRRRGSAQYDEAVVPG